MVQTRTRRLAPQDSRHAVDRLRVLRCHARDFVLLAAVAVLIAGVVIINIEGARHGWLYTMQFGRFM